MYENFQGKCFGVKIFSWVNCTHENYFTRIFFNMRARSKNLLCWRLPCIICDIQEAAIGENEPWSVVKSGCKWNSGPTER